MAKFILSRSKVLEQYGVAASISDKVSYSFKTNRDVGFVLRDQSDADFSVHSMHSVDLLACPDRLWYFAQGWEKKDIGDLLNKGVRRFVVDNLNDLDVLTDHINTADTKISLLLRMRLKENTIHTGKHFVYGMFSKDVNEQIQKLSKNQNIEELGIHFHRKTQNISEWSLKYELSKVLSDETLKCIQTMNIGGGIPSRYKNFRSDIIKNIISKISETKNWLNSLGIRLLIEPGRFIAAPSMELHAKVISLYDNNAIIDASIFNGAMDTFVSHIRLEMKDELPDGEGRAYTIKGMTPDSMDIFRYRVFFHELKKGEEVVFLNAGAYTYNTDFCGLPKIPVEIVD